MENGGRGTWASGEGPTEGESKPKPVPAGDACTAMSGGDPGASGTTGSTRDLHGSKG
jgi:hypothetical protein